MFDSIISLIEKHRSIHRVALSIWRHFPPRLAGFLKGIMTRNWLVGAVAVIIDDSAQPPEVLLVEHSYRRKGAWGLPGGSLDSIDAESSSPGGKTAPDHVIEEALRREIREELGIEIDVIRMLHVDVVRFVVEEPGPWRLDFYYRCVPVQGFGALRDSIAASKTAPVSPEIRQMRLVALSDLSAYDLYSLGLKFLQKDLSGLTSESSNQSGNR